MKISEHFVFFFLFVFFSSRRLHTRWTGDWSSDVCSSDLQEQRAAALWKLTNGSVKLLIAPMEAACMKLFPRDHYASLALRLRTGEEHIPEMLVEHLLSVGYTRVDVVEMPGQVTIRGGIVDAYGPEMERPVRIDFFGDEIESMRRFDPETQRSGSGSGS